MKKILLISIILSLLLSTNLVKAEYVESSNKKTIASNSSSGAKNGDLTSSDYKVDISSMGLGSNLKGETAKETAENVLGTIITKMIVAFGILALFIMTVGGAYMIFAHGQDELLNKGKGIFKAGIISLVVALGSGIIIRTVIYLIY